MSAKSLLVFMLMTLVLVVAAVVAVGSRPVSVSIPTDRALVFPDVAPGLNLVTEVEIRTPERTYTIARKGDKWGVKEINDYPVRFEKVKTALVDISKLRFLEAKTSDPERYDRLEVEDVTAKRAKSRRITVRAGDKVLASTIIGKRNDRLFGTDKGGTYLRKDGDPRSWLAEGIVRLGAGPADWVPTELMNINSLLIKSMVITSPSGAVVTIQRDSPKKKDFKLTAPKGKPVRGQWETNEMTKALENLKLEDLQVAGAVEFPGGPYVGVITTFDGVIIHTEAAELGPKGKKEHWVRFRAEVAPDAGRFAESARKQVTDINSRLKGYVYKVPEAVGKRLACELKNILEGAGINACA
jgi:hypothetical protein